MKKILCLAALPLALSAAEPAPLFRDFVGLCGHTVQFKPDLYKPVTRIVRDYHPMKWDLADDTSRLPDWPFARNRVSWEQVYGSWNKSGLKISACLQFDEMTNGWKNLEADARAYAKSFAENFGPGGKWPFVEALEIGNEPGLFDDPTYRKIFEAMASGIREGNSRVKIVTCNVEDGPSDRYWKSANLFTNTPQLYDVLQIHRYAISEQWPVWRRTYPENPKVPYLSSIQKLVDWRDANAKDKEVWVTEFGWDSSTQKPDPKGPWAKWVGSTDEEQAMWNVRSFLLFSAMNVQRAFIYFFNDKDEPSLHACSGLTRNFQPKPAYHAVAWMLRSLENHRFNRVLKSSLDDGYVYEFTPESKAGQTILAAWHPTKDTVALPAEATTRKILRAEKMPLTKDAPANLPLNALTIGQHPTLLWLAPN